MTPSVSCARATARSCSFADATRPARVTVDPTVVLFPEDQTLWLPQSRRLQGVPIAADGAYAFRGVPAGRYLLAIANDAEPGEWFDPAFLQRLMPTAVRVTIAGTDPVTIDLQRQ